MPISYTILSGEPTESNRKPDIYSVLADIPNNTQKLISPKDIRDAFLSAWSNSVIKVTSNGSSEYIGIDTNDPNSRDVKNKILLGKRSVGSQNIMTDSLIQLSDSDIFFYNTKQDSQDQSSTKISILAGTDPDLFTKSPYIESNSNSNFIDFNIVNESGNINIISENNRVYINNIAFPTILENVSNAEDGKFLKYSGEYPYGNLVWSDSVVSSIEIGASQTSTNIYGTVSLNGYLLEFVEDRVVPQSIGGILAGMSFSANSFNSQNWPIVEVIRELLYPYITPQLELEVINLESGNMYAEVGTEVNIEANYSITTYARDNEESISGYVFRDSGTTSTPGWEILDQGGSLTGTPGTKFSYTIEYSDSGNNIVGETLEYGLMVSNVNTGIVLDPQNSIDGYSFSQVKSIQFVAPFLFGSSETLYPFIGSSINAMMADANINKLIEYYPGDGNIISCQLSGTIHSYFYFAYPSDYPELKFIKDPNGYIIHDSDNLDLSSFQYSTIPLVPDSPLDYYGGYRIYITKNLVLYTGAGEFEFIF